MIAQPLLSICIATLNRANFIGETLDCLIKQLTPEVEIVIVDGASTDNTPDLIKAKMKLTKQIKYFRLDKKGGVDLDYCKSVEFAKGKMCWLFTDDDLIIEGTIAKIINFIKQEYSLIILNVQKRDFKLNKILQNKLCPIRSDIVFEEKQFDQFFSIAADPLLSFIGCVIINRELWLSRQKEKYFGTEFIHVGVIFQKPIPGKTLLSAQPSILIRWGNAQWVGRTFKIWAIIWPNLLSSFDHISIEYRKKYLPKPSWYFYQNLTYMKRIGHYSTREFNQYYKNMDLPFWWKCLLWLIAILPHFLFKIMMNGYAGIKKRLKKLFPK